MALTFPSSPTNGQIFTDTATGYRYIYNATAGVWAFSSNNVGMSVSSTPPGNVGSGSMWYNREIGRTFVYYNDGDSSQWVETVPAGAVDTNTIAAYTNPIFASMNGAYTTANAAYGQANTFVGVYGVANAAFSVANTALANTSGVSFNGSLTVPGNFISGSYGTPSTGTGWRLNSSTLYGQYNASDRILLNNNGDSWIAYGNVSLGTTSTGDYRLIVAGFGLGGSDPVCIRAAGLNGFIYATNEMNLTSNLGVTDSIYVNYRRSIANTNARITGYRFMDGGGSGTYTSCIATAFTPSSDYRIKSNTNTITENILDKVMELRPVTYHLYGDESRLSHGLIAHEVANTFPDMVQGEKDAISEKSGGIEPQTLDYNQLISVLIKSIQELNARIAALEGN